MNGTRHTAGLSANVCIEKSDGDTSVKRAAASLFRGGESQAEYPDSEPKEETVFSRKPTGSNVSLDGVWKPRRAGEPASGRSQATPPRPDAA